MSRQKRDLFNDIYQFSANVYSHPTFAKLKWSGDIPDGRKHHAGCIISQYLFFHGGVGQNGQVINDFVMFDIADMKFTDIG